MRPDTTENTSSTPLSNFPLIKPNLSNTKSSINGPEGINYKRGLNIGVVTQKSDGALKIMKCKILTQPIDVMSDDKIHKIDRCLLPLEEGLSKNKIIYFREIKITNKSLLNGETFKVYNYVILPPEHRVDNLPLCYLKKGKYHLYKGKQTAPKESDPVHHRINFGGGHLFAAELKDVYAAGEVCIAASNQVVIWNNQSGAYNNDRAEYSAEKKHELELQQQVFRSEYAIFPINKFIPHVLPNSAEMEMKQASTNSKSPEMSPLSTDSQASNTLSLDNSCRRLGSRSLESTPEIKQGGNLSSQAKMKIRLVEVVEKVIVQNRGKRKQLSSDLILKNQDTLATLRAQDLNTPPAQALQENIGIFRRALSFPFAKTDNVKINPLKVRPMR